MVRLQSQMKNLYPLNKSNKLNLKKSLLLTKRYSKL